MKRIVYCCFIAGSLVSKFSQFRKHGGITRQRGRAGSETILQLCSLWCKLFLLGTAERSEECLVSSIVMVRGQ